MPDVNGPEGASDPPLPRRRRPTEAEVRAMLERARLALPGIDEAAMTASLERLRRACAAHWAEVDTGAPVSEEPVSALFRCEGTVSGADGSDGLVELSEDGGSR
ncbi:hypothetical protein [Streptomyces alkaliphilus]|uniref:hypothetical protein n=1 Tax=Streptomyces alkaliphilus TaxID=1472722 RepID=UPI00117DFC7D|nr:hypothetical protein [Streptomyces alkaliphilus]MQS08083.1 hypothetical protein [Streptomyces alkaliphilus]